MPTVEMGANGCIWSGASLSLIIIFLNDVPNRISTAPKLRQHCRNTVEHLFCVRVLLSGDRVADLKHILNRSTL